jgi:hypothetical protein
MIHGLDFYFWQMVHNFTGPSWGLLVLLCGFTALYKAAVNHDERMGWAYLRERLAEKDWDAIDYWFTHDDMGISLPGGTYADLPPLNLACDLLRAGYLLPGPDYDRYLSTRLRAVRRGEAGERMAELYWDGTVQPGWDAAGRMRRSRW